MAEPLFRGVTALRVALAQFFASEMPGMIDQYREQFGLNAYELPHPVKYDGYEPQGLDDWPTIGVSIANTRGFRRMDTMDDGGERFMATYDVRVFQWCRTPMNRAGAALDPKHEYEATIRVRDDMAACMRAVLLRKLSCGQPGIISNEQSITESFSEASPTKNGNRFLASSILAWQLQYDESIPLLIIGTADEINVDAQLIDQEA